MKYKKRFAGYPSAVAFEEPNGEKPVQHLLWGAFIQDKGDRKGSYEIEDVHGIQQKGQYLLCHIQGRRKDCWIREHEIQDERLLEVIFVDIGQGDGCLVVTPDDKKMIIDAGKEDNMYRFLRWRFGQFRKDFTFDAGIISHPDSDHYHGFNQFFDDPKVNFDTIYCNGIMEQFSDSVTSSLGPKKKYGKNSFITRLVTSKPELQDFLNDKTLWMKKSKSRTSKKQYPAMLKKALDKNMFNNFKMLSIQDGFMPGFKRGKDLTIQILGPIIEPAGNSSSGLRWFGSVGKTKNGHSVVLRFNYRNVSLMLGGDLNIPSQNLLLSHHTGLKSPPRTLKDKHALVKKARKIFQVDIAKSCHHGSSDFSPLYLSATNPIATIISSGDDEPYSHPRADTLGAIGRYSQGDRPLIFSTELARSTQDRIKHPHILRRDLKAQLQKINNSPATSKDEQDKRKKKIERFEKKMDKIIDRSVAVFGAINVITDGYKVVIAQKLERKRNNGDKWDIYRLETKGNKPLRFQSKH